MNFLERQLKDPIRFARIKLGFSIGLAVVLLADIVLPLIFHDDHHFSFEGWPAWGSLYGLISCVAIIVISKFIGKAGLMRREGHYDD